MFFVERNMRALVVIAFFLISSVSFAIDRSAQVITEYPEYRIIERKDFDEKLFSEQLSAKQLENLNGEYGKTNVDLNNDGKEDYLVFTYKKKEKPTIKQNYKIQTVYLVSCISGSKCKIVRELQYAVPIQHYLTSGPLWDDMSCNGELYKKGTPTFHISPVLGNVWEWNVYSDGKYITCYAGD